MEFVSKFVRPRASWRSVAVAAAVLMFGVPRHAAADEDRCALPDGVMGIAAPLPRVAAALKPGETLQVLVVGSATVFSPVEASKTEGAADSGATSTSEAAFPRQMAQVLRASHPGVKIAVTIRGGRGLTAAGMLDIIRGELAARHYQLVIWQTGTVEAVRTIPVGEFYQTLSEGAALLKEAGADLVLIDPQYSRFLQANSDLDPYEQTMQSVAALPGVVLFRRFDAMRYWAAEGPVDLERTPRPRRQEAAELLHVCLGQALARMVTEASREAS